jgi:hypothetical protein
MPIKRLSAVLPAILLSLLLLGIAACVVRQSKDSNGDDQNVSIVTPAGTMHIGKDADVQDTGLPVYPGARSKPNSKDDDQNKANVNISSSFFGLKVVAVEYLSDDPPAKVLDYYKMQLKRYGSVLECRSTKKVDKFNADIDMKEDNEKGRALKCEGDNTGNNIELKVGTTDNQHIVSIEPNGTGTDFGLVAVKVHGHDTI